MLLVLAMTWASVCPSVCLSVCQIAVLCQNGASGRTAAIARHVSFAQITCRSSLSVCHKCVTVSVVHREEILTI